MTDQPEGRAIGYPPWPGFPIWLAYSLLVDSVTIVFVWTWWAALIWDFVLPLMLWPTTRRRE